MARIAMDAMRRTAGAFLLAICVIIGGADPAAAANVSERFAPGDCYARTYSAAHLAEHPRQRVAHIWFTHEPSLGSSPDRFALRFGFSLRDGRSYESVAYCGVDGRCAVEADGGRIQFADRGRSLLMSVTDYLVVEGRDFSPNLMDSDDRAFLLHSSEPAACR